MKSGDWKLEKLARALTVFTFILVCWVGHRSVQDRSDCIHSAHINLVLEGDTKVYNCRYESRLSLSSLWNPLSYATVKKLRALDGVNGLVAIWPDGRPQLTVEIVTVAPRFFEIGKGYLRLGEAWFEEPEQLRRAVIMGVLNARMPSAFPNPFELEVVTDFLNLAFFPTDGWTKALKRDVKFSTTAPSFEQYCRSPFRSLIHDRDCRDSLPSSGDLFSRVWGFRSLLAVSLWRIFDRSSLRAKIQAVRNLRDGAMMPLLLAPYDESGASLALWFTDALREHLATFGLNQNVSALKSTLKVFEVEAPTHWELTVDLTNTPAWRAILSQLRKRAAVRPNERTLVFTPEGSVALPSGLPVEWTASDISSQDRKSVV